MLSKYSRKPKLLINKRKTWKMSLKSCKSSTIQDSLIWSRSLMRSIMLKRTETLIRFSLLSLSMLKTENFLILLRSVDSPKRSLEPISFSYWKDWTTSINNKSLTEILSQKISYSMKIWTLRLPISDSLPPLMEEMEVVKWRPFSELRDIWPQKLFPSNPITELRLISSLLVSSFSLHSPDIPPSARLIRRLVLIIDVSALERSLNSGMLIRRTSPKDSSQMN